MFFYINLERRICTYIMSVAASALLLRSIFPFDMSSYYERHTFYRKHFWCFSTFRTKNIHIYLVCCCQSTLATIDIPFRASITNRTRFVENISGVFPRLERRIFNNYSMIPRWIWSDKITNERYALVGYNHFISNKGEWNNCFSKFSNRVLPPIFISTILQSENL